MNMDDKQEHIEEMADIKSVLIKTHKRCRTLQEDYMQNKYAEGIYKAGYRKASEVIDEFVERIMTDADAFLSNMSRNIIRICASKMKKEISYEMRREVE